MHRRTRSSGASTTRAGYASGDTDMPLTASPPLDSLSPEEDRGEPERAHRPVRSFVLRQGRISPAQQRACDELYPRYGIAPTTPLAFGDIFGRDAPVVLEIGFGMGETTAAIAAAQP